MKAWIDLCAVLLMSAEVAQAQEQEPNPRVPSSQGSTREPEGGNPGSRVSAESFDSLPTAVGPELPPAPAGKPWTSPATQALIRQLVLASMVPVLGVGAAVVAGVATGLWLRQPVGEPPRVMHVTPAVMMLAGIAPGLAMLALGGGAVTMLASRSVRESASPGLRASR